MDGQQKLFAIIAACIAVGSPLGIWARQGGEKAKAEAWGVCVANHPVADCKKYAP